MGSVCRGDLETAYFGGVPVGGKGAQVFAHLHLPLLGLGPLLGDINARELRLSDSGEEVVSNGLRVLRRGWGVSIEMAEGSWGTWGSNGSICYSCLLLKTVKIQKSIEKRGILQE